MDMPATPFDRLGGRPAIAALVARFYAIMDSDPAHAALRAMHGADLAPMVDSLTDFLVAWTGGPRDWFDARPGACIMSAHATLPGLGEETARQWMAAMTRAAEETVPGDPGIRAAMLEAFGRMCAGMAARTAAAR